MYFFWESALQSAAESLVSVFDQLCLSSVGPVIYPQLTWADLTKHSIFGVSSGEIRVFNINRTPTSAAVVFNKISF